jgi:uncharacterized protein YggT (Ycf19 family)
MRENPEVHYEKKKAIFRFYQVVWYLLGLVEALLSFRIIFKAFGANPLSPFSQFIYGASEPFVIPFRGLFRTITEEGFVFELSTFIAMIVYFVFAYGLVELIQLIKPTTPEEVEQNV